MTLKRRTVLATLVASNGLFLCLPKTWQKPIVDSIVLPAHAMTSVVTSECSAFEEEMIDQDIVITISASEVLGPIIAPLSANGSFNDTQSLITGQSSDGIIFSQEVQFFGAINSNNNQVSGDLIIKQFSGSDLVCEQISTFITTQTPVDSSTDLGEYVGQVVGSITCCQDFL